MLKVQTYKCVFKRDGRPLRVAETAVDCYERAVSVAHAYLGAFPHEEVIAILLNGQNEVMGVAKLAQGGIHGCALTPGDVLRPVLVSGASAFVLAHNHTSGDPEPSPEDIAMTRAICLACDVVGVPILDHVIVTRDRSRHSSLLEKGAI